MSVALLFAALAAQGTAPVAPEIETSSTATVGARRPTHHGPMVAMLDTYMPPLNRGMLPVSDARLLAFGQQLADSAREVFLWRRWSVLPAAQLQASLEALTIDGDCTDDRCFARVAVEAGATHALISSLSAPRAGGCRAAVAFYDLLSAELVREVDRSIQPCSDDSLLAVATEIGQELAAGSRAPLKITLDLTPRTLPHLDVADVGEVPRYIVESSTRADRVFELERALEIYKEQHMFVFDAEDSDGYYIARSGQLLSECDVRRVASAPRPKEIEEYCEGNDWEWAWIGVPAGSLVMLGSYSDFKQGGFTGVLGFAIGVVMTSVSGGLALGLNVDKKDPKSGAYYSSRTQIESIVKMSNAQLRDLLQLSEAEVVVSGMRL